MTGTQRYSVLPSKFGGGPFGLGDPEDKSLRKVELDILIPKKMRDKAKFEKCTEEVQKFTECGKASGFAMVFSCRKENAGLKDCLTKWYQDPDFQNQCKEEYLKERSEYRRTGVNKNRKEGRLPTSM